MPTIALERLSPAQARAYMIADNRLTDTSVWDDALLASALKDLSLIDLEFSLEATDFSMGEIDFRIEGLDMPAKSDPADALLALSTNSGFSRTLRAVVALCCVENACAEKLESGTAIHGTLQHLESVDLAGSVANGLTAAMG